MVIKWVSLLTTVQLSKLWIQIWHYYHPHFLLCINFHMVCTFYESNHLKSNFAKTRCSQNVKQSSASSSYNV